MRLKDLKTKERGKADPSQSTILKTHTYIYIYIHIYTACFIININNLILTDY